MIPRENMGPVQVQPAGFLGLLQLKTMGRAPSTIPDTQQPTIDLREWLFATQSQVILGEHFLHVTGALTGRTFFGYSVDPGSTALEVPNDEWWYVQDYSVHITNVVDSNASAVLAMLDPVAGAVAASVHILSQEMLVGSAAGSASAAVRECDVARGFWARPGAELGLWLVGFHPAADFRFSAAITVTRLPI